MIILDTTTRSLEVDLNTTVTTNQLPFVASYVDINQSTFAMSAMASNTGATNNTTAVTLVAVPGATTSRVLKYLSIKNSDTVSTVLWIQMNDNATLREIWKGTLAVGDTLVYVDSLGFNVLNSSGQIKTTTATAGIGTIGSSTDNALVRWDGTGGTNVQDSSWTLSDTHVLTAAGNLALGTNSISRTGTAAGLSLDASNNATLSGTLTASGAIHTLGSAVAATNVTLNIAGVAGKAARIYFKAGSTESWAIGKGAASENEDLELYNGALGKFALRSSSTTGVTTLGDTAGAVVTGTLTVSGAGGLTLSATASPTGTGAGAVGQIAWDTAYLYVCTATNDWRRIALVDF